jgi:hypothetical protein
MAKTYSDELDEWLKRRQSTKPDQNLAAFRAVRDDVKEALEAGYTITAIWQNLYESKRIDSNYDTFSRYISRHIRCKHVKPADVAPTLPNPRPDKMPQSKVPKTALKVQLAPVQPPATPPGFTFNSTPKKEDLI